MTMTALPPAPLPTDDTATFNSKAFAIVAALNTFIAQANAIVVNLNSDQLFKDASGNLIVGGSATARAKLDIQNNLAGSVQTTGLHIGYSAGDFYGYRAVNINDPSLAHAGIFAIQRGNGSAWVNDIIVGPSGNVGIGTSSPVAKLTSKVDGAAIAAEMGTSTSSVQIAVYNSSSVKVASTISYGSAYSGGSVFNVGPNGTAIVQEANAPLGIGTFGVAQPLIFGTSSQEGMRLNAESNLCIGSTSQIVGGANHKMTLTYPGGGILYGLGIRALSDNTVAVNFANSVNTQVGSIYVSASTTSYNTSSDYRLKENVAPMTGALSKVVALKPCTYRWKADGSLGQGFIAHELQAVIPDCVTGEKDGMRTENYEISPAVPATFDEDGEIIEAAVEAVMGEREVPSYQGVDTSFLVATLVSAFQEAHGMIKDLQNRVEVLEA